MLEHSVENGQQLAHAGSQGYFLGLSSFKKALVESPHHRVVPGSCQGGSQLSQLHQQIGNPWSIIRDLPDLPAGTHANVQVGLGYINPHVTVSNIHHIHLLYLLAGPALQDSGFLGPGNCSGSLGWGGATLLSHGFLNPG